MARDERLRNDRNLWLATGAGAVTTRNVRVTPRVVLALEHGNDPIVAGGTVAVHERPYPDDVDGPFDALWEVTVDRGVM